MKPVRFLLSTLALSLCLIARALAAEETKLAKPNVIVILTDDMGWADLGAQGMEKDVKTPNLDALAAAGVRCTAGYVTSPCAHPPGRRSSPDAFNNGTGSTPSRMTLSPPRRSLSPSGLAPLGIAADSWANGIWNQTSSASNG